jgi:hypothetical protein
MRVDGVFGSTRKRFESEIVKELIALCEVHVLGQNAGRIVVGLFEHVFDKLEGGIDGTGRDGFLWRKESFGDAWRALVFDLIAENRRPFVCEPKVGYRKRKLEETGRVELDFLVYTEPWPVVEVAE